MVEANPAKSKGQREQQAREDKRLETGRESGGQTEQARRGKKEKMRQGAQAGSKGNGHKRTRTGAPTMRTALFRSPGFPRGILRGLGSRLDERLGMCEINVKVNKQSCCHCSNRSRRMRMSLPYRRGLALEMDGLQPWRCCDKVQGPSGAHCTHAAHWLLPLASHWGYRIAPLAATPEESRDVERACPGARTPSIRSPEVEGRNARGSGYLAARRSGR